MLESPDGNCHLALHYFWRWVRGVLRGLGLLTWHIICVQETAGHKWARQPSTVHRKQGRPVSHPAMGPLIETVHKMH